jgi:hypothetical protein
VPFIPANNVVQTELIFTWASQIVENVLHYQFPGGVTTQRMQDLGTQLVAWYASTLDSIQGPGIQLTEVRMTDLTSEFAPGQSTTAGLPLSGTAAGADLPNNVALSITKRTNFRGRAYRGRIYHMALTEPQVTGNVVLPATVTAILGAYSAIRVLTIDGVEVPMVVVSKYQGGEPRAAALVTPIASFSTDGIVDSQRRRLPKRGS